MEPVFEMRRLEPDCAVSATIYKKKAPRWAAPCLSLDQSQPSLDVRDKHQFDNIAEYAYSFHTLQSIEAIAGIIACLPENSQFHQVELSISQETGFDRMLHLKILDGHPQLLPASHLLEFLTASGRVLAFYEERGSKAVVRIARSWAGLCSMRIIGEVGPYRKVGRALEALAKGGESPCKTWTAAAIIHSAVQLGIRMLATAPTNLASTCSWPAGGCSILLAMYEAALPTDAVFEPLRPYLIENVARSLYEASLAIYNKDARQFYDFFLGRVDN
ncbi:hypothetical protein PAPYR_10071 [Paratrimastix pyriformis]|uniref:Uncharacterized protein n=1 Tax=Paratrimastix pyriformis TaxID=342808 RepID=A0ABQ8U6V4_9EUKA|nr:hypothetical protein PAPYR_10071 [Paratrimastix pyriformis]